MDNIHAARSADADGDDLVVTFNEDEELRLTRPTHWEFSETVFGVQNADRVVWRWYSYGRPKTTEHLLTIEHWVDEEGIVRARSDESWRRRTFGPLRSLPAAELL